MDKAKAKRSSNFTKKEELILVKEVFKLKDIVESKITNKTAIIDKDIAWKSITENFNSKNNHFRSIEQLRIKYDNLKTKTRKMISNKKKVQYQQTDSDSFSIEEDRVVDIVLNIINTKIAKSHEATIDSNFVPIDIDEQLEIKEEDLDYSDYENIDSVSIDPISTTPPPQPPASTSNNVPNKTQYTRNKLKISRSRKSKHYKFNPVEIIKEDYYKHKILLIKAELEEHEKKAERERKEDERKQEEHERKIRLLDLEIREKKRNLE